MSQQNKHVEVFEIIYIYIDPSTKLLINEAMLNFERRAHVTGSVTGPL